MAESGEHGDGARPVVQVKICGVTNAADAREATRAGAWAVGINFYPESRRYVERDAAVEIARAARPAVVVGVFVDASRAEIERTRKTVDLDAVQLHGDESPEECAGWAVPVIKALRIRDASSWAAAARYEVAYILADAYSDVERGGTGRAIAPQLLPAGADDRLIVAGGLNEENLGRVLRRVRPFAVDVCSGVERDGEPRRKDASKMTRFIGRAHAA